VRTRVVLITVVALASAGALPWPALAEVRAPSAATVDANSNVWAGYRANATAGDLDTVTAQFSQQADACETRNPSLLLIEAGYGTAGTMGAAQVGTGALCASQGATPQYYAWWRVGQTSQFIPLAIHESDPITVSVGLDRDDLTVVVLAFVIGRGESSWQRSFSAAQLDRRSAACLVERARLNGSLTPLPNFGNIDVTGCTVGGKDIRNRPGQINGSGPWDATRYTMVRFKPTGTTLPLVELFDGDPLFWSVNWRHN
jgi:hypothetical protein